MNNTPPLGKQDKVLSSTPDGSTKVEHIASDAEMSCKIAEALNRIAEKMQDNTISLAERSIEARKFLDMHTDHVRKSWMDWNDESAKVMESIRQTRVAIGFESKKLLEECADARACEQTGRAHHGQGRLAFKAIATGSAAQA